MGSAADLWSTGEVLVLLLITVIAVLSAVAAVRFAVLLNRSAQRRQQADAELRDRERATAEEQLQASEELDRFFNLSADLLFVANEQGYCTRVNPAVQRILGWTAEEFTSRPYLDLVHPDDQEFIREQAARIAGGESVLSAESRLRHRDGSYRWLSWSGTSQGPGTPIYAVARDITERRQTLEELDQFFNLSLDMLCITEADYQVVRVNPAVQRMLGWAPEEIVGTSYLDLVHPEDVERTVSAEQRLTHDGMKQSHEVRVRARDGSYRWMSWSARTGKSGRHYAIGRDIHVEKQHTLTVQGLLDTAPDATLVLDADGRIEMANQRAQGLFGYLARELVGERAAKLFAPEVLESFERERARYFAAPFPRPVGSGLRTRGRRRDGTEFPADVGLSPLETEHGVVVSAVVRDISGQLAAERELTEARDTALRASWLKSQFLASTSHEIRTPMNGVIGLTELILDTPLDETQRRYATGIQTAAKALLAVINDLLDLSKIEAARVDLVEVGFTVAPVVAEATELAAGSAAAKQLRLDQHCDPALPPVFGDPARLRQVLLNLINNAIKFTDQGSVEVRAIRADVPGPPGGPAPTEAAGAGPVIRLRIEVRDTGPGIPEDQQRFLFEPFTQATPFATRRHGGTGLGLAISRQLVHAMGGEIGVDSTPGQGSTFWFTVPLRTTASRPAHDAPNWQSLAGRRILLVEANEAVQAILSSYLRDWDMKPVVAANAETAVELLRTAGRSDQAGGRGDRAERADIAAAVVDHDLPGGGLALTHEIVHTWRVPVAVLCPEQIDVAAVRAAGARASLSRPVRRSQLYNALVRLLTTDLAPTGAQPPDSVPESSAGRQGRALLVEDNDTNQLVAASILGKLGFELDVAGDGAQAVEMTGRQPYDLVVMDVQMPVMDGYEATRRIRTREGVDRHTPIIAMTAGAYPENRAESLSAGMDDYIAKPFTPTQLAEVVSRATRATGSPAGRPVGEPPQSAAPIDSAGDLPQGAAPIDSAGDVPQGAAPIDRALVVRLRGRLDEIGQPDPVADRPLLRRLVDSFLTETPERIDRLSDAVRSGDADTVEHEAHTLSGAAGNLGASELAARCRALEELGRQGDLAASIALLAQTRTAYDRVHRALEEIAPTV